MIYLIQKMSLFKILKTNLISKQLNYMMNEIASLMKIESNYQIYMNYKQDNKI